MAFVRAVLKQGKKIASSSIEGKKIVHYDGKIWLAAGERLTVPTSVEFEKYEDGQYTFIPNNQILFDKGLLCNFHKIEKFGNSSLYITIVNCSNTCALLESSDLLGWGEDSL